MTIWLPGLLVLVAGAVLGWWWVRRSAGRAADPRAAKLAEQKLRLQDLTQRKQDLLARLQSGVEDLDGAERQRLEIEAARVLREMDQIAAGGARGAAPSSPPAPVKAAAQAAAPLQATWLRRNPLLTGFLFGGGMVGLAALLIFLAARDSSRNADGAGAPTMARGGGAPLATGAQQTPGVIREPGPAPGAAAGEPAQGHPAMGQAATTPEIDQLTQMVEAQPSDIDARRRLAIAYLGNNQMVEAFQQAKFVLQAAPADPDGHMVTGVVRMAMGNLDEAGANLDAALAARPNDPVAHLYRGLVWAQTGDAAKALDVWERGRQAAGGSFPQIEQLIAETRQAMAAGAGGSTQRAAESPAPPPAQTQKAPASAPMGGMAAAPAGMASMAGMAGPAAVAGSQAAPAAGGATFPVRVELGAGVTSPPGAVLFVSLRPGPAGPPVAVRRIEPTGFPFDLELNGADVMMGGGQLPNEGHLTVRLDRDGNATTREPDEPMASLAVVAGKPATLVLAVQR